MSRRWFGDPADEAALGATLARLVEDVSRLLERLDRVAEAPVAPGAARVDAEAAAVVLPLRRIPGASLVVQVAEWSSSVGCWWSTAGDPTTAPAAEELFAEFPLRPDGPGRAVAWLERELRRPVVEREHRYGVAHRQVWSVVLDDGRELAVRDRWRAGAAWALGGVGPGQDRWLLGVAVAAAGLRWVLNVASPQLIGAGWLAPAGWALHVLGFAALLVWFGVAGLDHPPRVRAPMLAGLLLAALAPVVRLLLPSPMEVPSPSDSLPELLARHAAEWVPALLWAAAVACYLVAFLGLPGRAAPRPPWPRVLPVAAGLAWGIDLAVGLTWLGRFQPLEERGAATAWYGALQLLTGAVALGLAVVLAFVVLDRRAGGMARRPARAGLAGAVLLALGSSALVQTAVTYLAPLLPHVVALAGLGAAFGLLEFAGTALVTAAVVEAPLTPAPGAGPPAPLRSPAR